MIKQLQETEKAHQEMKRQAFEKLPEVADSLSEHIVFIGNKYTTPNQGFCDLVNWLNGAWYAWQAAQEQMLQETTWNDYSIISPAIEGRYQIFINGEQLAADWIDKFGFADPFDGDALRQDLITHWQSLPQPPKQ